MYSATQTVESDADAISHRGKGYSVQKTLGGCAVNMGLGKSASWYINDPLQNLVRFGIYMGRFFKIFPNLRQNWLNFRTFFF